MQAYWWDARVVESGRLENDCRRKVIAGSNPAPTATLRIKLRVAFSYLMRSVSPVALA